MIVTHCYRTFFPDTQGGLEEVIRQICYSTQSAGHSSVVVYVSKKVKKVEQGEFEGISTLLLPEGFEVGSCNIPRSGFKELKAAFKNCDIVHYHYPWPTADLMHLLIRPSKPCVVTYHSDVVRQKLLDKFYEPLRRYFLSSVDSIVATSPQYFESSQVLQCFKEKVQVLPLGIQKSSYPESTPFLLDEVKRKYGKNFFFFVGVLRYYKGLEYLLGAAKGAKFPVIIAGSGPEETRLKSLAMKLGLENVHFIDRISDEEKVAYLAQCRAVVFPSHLRSEAFGITLLEGAMMGKPLISCDIGSGMSYVNPNGVTGIEVPPRNPVALRKAMETLYHDDELAAEYGRNARKRYEELFTGEKMGQAYVDLYRRLLAEKRP